MADAAEQPRARLAFARAAAQPRAAGRGAGTGAGGQQGGRTGSTGRRRRRRGRRSTSAMGTGGGSGPGEKGNDVDDVLRMARGFVAKWTVGHGGGSATWVEEVSARVLYRMVVSCRRRMRSRDGETPEVLLGRGLRGRMVRDEERRGIDGEKERMGLERFVVRVLPTSMSWARRVEKVELERAALQALESLQ